MSSVYFNPAVGGDGSTVTDDANATTGLANGGHRTRFVPALSQTVAVAANTVTQATNAANSAAASADSATTALNAPGTQGTSTTSLAIGLGSKSLTLAQTGKAFVVGQYVQIVNSTTGWMVGLITAFTSGTGAMTVNVTNSGGTGTLASWTVTPTNPPELPSQSGNATKFLKTDGSVDSWQLVYPDPTVSAGKFLRARLDGFVEWIGIQSAQIISTNTALMAGWHYRLTGSTDLTVTLPATPATGDAVLIADGNSISTGANHTIARNGQTIMGSAEDLIMDAADVNVGLWFDGTTWRVV